MLAYTWCHGCRSLCECPSHVHVEVLHLLVLLVLLFGLRSDENLWSMGKKGGGGGVGYGSNKKPLLTSGLLQHQPVSLRQQTGRGGGGGGGAAQALNPSQQATALRAEHLLRIATWASANAPPLGALLGARLGCLCEAAGVPVPDTPHSICERCESIMQVGVNCSVRVTKNKRKGKSSKAGNICNYVTYVCHFCNHGNAKPGTSKNHLKTKISQVAARANLEMLGKSTATEIRSVDKKTSTSNLTKKNQQGSAEQEDSKYVQISLDKGPLDVTEKNQQGGAEQEGAKAEEMTLDKVEQDSAKAEEMTLDKVEQEGAKVVEMTLDKVEQEGAKAVEITLDKGPSDLMEKSQQGSPGQEAPETVEMTLDKGPLDLMEKSHQGFAEQEGLKAVETTLDKGPLDITENKRQVSPEQEGPKSVEISLTRKTLDLTKKKKKKNQQESAEQEGPRPSLSKGLVVESSDSTKKRKRKGWSTLKELAGIPQ